MSFLWVAFALWCFTTPLVIVLGWLLYERSKSIKPHRFVKQGSEVKYYTTIDGKPVFVDSEKIEEIKSI